MSTSITAVNAKLIADAKQFIAEFERAQAGAKKSAEGIDKQIDHLGKNIKRKFSAADIGKDLMKGLGIGSGFQLAQEAAQQLVGYFEKQAEQAKAIEESTAKQLEYTKQIIALRQTPEQQEATVRAEYARAERALKLAKEQGAPVVSMSGAYSVRSTSYRRENEEEIHRLSEEYKRLGVEVEKFNKATKDNAVTAVLERRTEIVTNEAKRYDELQKGIQRVRDGIDKNAEELDKLIEKTRDSADPRREYERELERINLLLQANKISADEAFGARKALAEKFYAGAPNKSGISIENDDLADMSKYAEEATHAAEELGMAFSSAFEDAIVSGNKLSEVLDGLIKDIMRLFIRQTITKPLAESLSGTFASWNLFRADGGPVSASSPYIVGERGPELFVPSSNGTVIPNHAISSRGSAGNVYQIDARGTDESVIQRLQQALFALAGPGVVERRALSAQVSSLRRGGGMGRALQGA